MSMEKVIGHCINYAIYTGCEAVLFQHKVTKYMFVVLQDGNVSIGHGQFSETEFVLVVKQEFPNPETLFCIMQNNLTATQ